MRLGISSCLLGNKCRYDGSGARDKYIVDTLSEYFDFAPYCPEATFLPTPRNTIRLVDSENGVKAEIEAENNRDVTEELISNSKTLINTIPSANICGFILKSKSPSCGMERVKVYQNNNSKMHEKKGVGLFAEELKKQFPYLPIEEESRLNDPWLRENFLMQVYSYQDLFDFIKSNPSMKELVTFHTSYKYIFMSKNFDIFKELGQIVANHDKKELNIVLEEYKELFLKGISYKNSINKTYTVLEKTIGFFDFISKEQTKELLDSLNEFKNKTIPLISIIKMLNIYIGIENIEYLKNQKFFKPYPEELALRSYINAYK